jgi:hypothetical protein
MAGGLPRCRKLPRPVRQTRLLAGPPVYEPALVAASESRAERAAGERIRFAGVIAESPTSGEILNGLFDEIRGSLMGIAGAVEFHRAIALVVAIF